MSKIKLGLVGCGGMAETHMQHFEALGSRVSLVAVVDAVAERAAVAGRCLPGVRTATDYRDVLDDVDAVLLVLPHHLHHPVAKACLEAGKHVLLEKPMANSEQECLDLIHAEETTGRILMIAYCMRYHPLVTRMKDLLDRRAYGDVFQVSIWTEQLTCYPAEHWASRAATLGGGQLFSHGCHYIDLLLWCLGRPLRGTHTGTNSGTPWMEREGTSNVCVEFEGGRLGYHFGTWGARGTRLQYSIHVHCTEGMLEVDISGGKLLVHRQGQTKLLLETEEEKYTQNEMAHFLDCIETGQRPLTDGPGSLQGLRLIWRLYGAEAKNMVADLRGLGLDEWKGTT